MTLSEEVKAIREYFEYRDGKVFWRKVKGSRGVVGKRFGCREPNGYQHGVLNGKTYREHQLVWALVYGYIPRLLDHIDGDTGNNKVENLREVSHSQNMMNATLRKDNKTGCKGVIWSKEKNKYRVEIRSNNVKRHLGYFEDLELACLVASEARDLYHGKHARFN
jgi:hypothetical protein